MLDNVNWPQLKDVALCEWPLHKNVAQCEYVAYVNRPLHKEFA